MATLEQNRIPHDILGRELRFVTVADLEFRDEDDGEKAHFTGHAAVFDTPTDIGGWFREVIAPGAFKRTIKQADIRLLFNHNPDLVLARNKAGTLKLSEDSIGLLTDAELDRRQTYANDLAIAMERGDVNQMSFAFRAVKDEWEKDGEAAEAFTLGATRTILEAKLYDVSPVTYPAYTETDAALRSAGFDLLCKSLEIPEDKRTELLAAVARGDTDAISELRRPVSEEAPDVTTEGSVETDHPEVDPEAAARKHRYLAQKFGLIAA